MTSTPISHAGIWTAARSQRDMQIKTPSLKKPLFKRVLVLFYNYYNQSCCIDTMLSSCDGLRVVIIILKINKLKQTVASAFLQFVSLNVKYVYLAWFENTHILKQTFEVIAKFKIIQELVTIFELWFQWYSFGYDCGSQQSNCVIRCCPILHLHNKVSCIAIKKEILQFLINMLLIFT